MATTTIRLDDDLKARVSGAAQRAGKTSHAFILEAIAESVENSEIDDEFHQKADQRWAKLLTNGKSVSLDEAKAYLEARLRGERLRKPVARKLIR